MAPNINGNSGTSETSHVSEGSDATTAGIVQEFEIENGTVTSIETMQDFLPATLGLEAVSKEDMGVV
jgi:hypothetical protein